MAVESTSAPAWSDLLPELLGRIAACCPKPVDRASFRAACRSWHAAARLHCPRTPLLPWAVLPDGSFLALSDGGRDDLPPEILPYGEYVQAAHGPRSLALPENTTCVGSTGSWLALRHRRRDAWRLGDDSSFLLHNPFTGATVPLPEVDAVAARAPPDVFNILKMLMRSTAGDDVVVFLSNSRSYPFVLCVPGKGAWVPEPLAPPFMHIVDVAFLGEGDKLYGITKAEDLFSFDLAVRDGQIPEVTGCERVIRHPLDDQGYDYVQWSDVDDVDGQDYHDEGEEESSESEHSSGSSDSDDEYDDNKNAEFVRNLHVPSRIDRWFDEDEEPPREIITIRYLVDANGKLIMVRRHLRFPEPLPCPRHTCKVEVLEADTDAGTWVPVHRLGGGGQALFISKRFSKCVSASAYEQGRLEEDAIYFMDSGEVFDMRSGAISPALWCLCFFRPTWVFPPDL